MRDKVKKLETDYTQVIQDLRHGFDKKEALYEEYKKMPKQGNREIYVKRIIEITQNYN